MARKLGMEAKLYRNNGSFASPDWIEIGNVKDLSLFCRGCLEFGEWQLCCCAELCS